MIKYLYTVGDSFTYGDQLLDSVINKYPELKKWGTNNFSIQKINEIYIKSKLEHDWIINLKDSMSWPGKLAKLLNCNLINYSQSGASIDSILFQLYFAIDDIKTKQLNKNECLIIIGLTSPFRKPLIDVEYMNEYLPKDFLVRCTSGSVMISNPDSSIKYSKPLAEAYGKYISIDQLVVEFVFQLVNIDNILKQFGTPYLLLNIWNHSFLKDINNMVMRQTAVRSLELFNTIKNIWPNYPDSLVTKFGDALYTTNLVTPHGHPNEVVHTGWAEMLLPKIKEILYEFDTKTNKSN